MDIRVDSLSKMFAETAALKMSASPCIPAS